MFTAPDLFILDVLEVGQVIEDMKNNKTIDGMEDIAADFVKRVKENGSTELF